MTKKALCLYLCVQNGSLQLYLVQVGEGVQALGGEEGEDARLLAHAHAPLSNHTPLFTSLLLFLRGKLNISLSLEQGRKIKYSLCRLYDRTPNNWTTNDWMTNNWTTNDWTTKTNATEQLTTERLIWTTNIQKIRQFNIMGKTCQLNNKNIIIWVRLGKRYGSACILR